MNDGILFHVKMGGERRVVANFMGCVRNPF